MAGWVGGWSMTWLKPAHEGHEARAAAAAGLT